MGTDPQTDNRIALPPDFADHLAAVSNLETPPETLGDYWALFAEAVAASDQTIEPADLYTADPTRHEVRVNGQIRYSPCVLDALGAAVMEAPDPVTVRSVDPVTRTPVTFTVNDGSMEVTPEAAVITFGITATIPELEDSDETIFSWMLQAETPSLTNAFCQYINAFESADTYAQWAAETNGETAPFQPAAVWALIRRFEVID